MARKTETKTNANVTHKSQFTIGKCMATKFFFLCNNEGIKAHKTNWYKRRKYIKNMLQTMFFTILDFKVQYKGKIIIFFWDYYFT